MSGINKTGAQPTQLPSLSFEGTQKPAAPSTETNAIDRLNLSFDSFEVGPSTSRPASEKGRRAVETFHNKLDSIMNPDAMALANGARPVNPGDAFTDAQKDRLVGAAKDMMMDMPLSDLSPEIVQGLESALGEAGIEVGSLEGKSLKDFGKLGGDLAKQFAENLREESPGVFYGLAATAAVAVGAHGYMNGSEAIRKLGIKPEFSTSLFNKRLQITAEADWGPKFSDPSLSLGASGDIWRGQNGRLNLGGTINTEGDATLRLNGAWRNGDFTANGNINLDTDGDLSAGGSVRWQPTDNFDAGLTGRVKDDGTFRVGVGVRRKF